MRTSIYLDDHLAERLKRAAAARRMSLSAFLAAAGRAFLEPPPSESEEFELLTYGSGGVRTGVSLDRTAELLAADDLDSYGRCD